MTKHILPSYLHLALVLFNAFFIFQILLGFFSNILILVQWVLIIGNFVLLILGLISINRRDSSHFSPHEATIYQLLFFILFTAIIAALLILLVSDPISFLIAMPFEFFLLIFYIAFYFLMTRYIFPHKKPVT